MAPPIKKPKDYLSIWPAVLILSFTYVRTSTHTYVDTIPSGFVCLIDMVQTAPVRISSGSICPSTYQSLLSPHRSFSSSFFRRAYTLPALSHGHFLPHWSLSFPFAAIHASSFRAQDKDAPTLPQAWRLSLSLFLPPSLPPPLHLSFPPSLSRLLSPQGESSEGSTGRPFTTNQPPSVV